jgi:hypothetical protein
MLKGFFILEYTQLEGAMESSFSLCKRPKTVTFFPLTVLCYTIIEIERTNVEWS